MQLERERTLDLLKREGCLWQVIVDLNIFWRRKRVM